MRTRAHNRGHSDQQRPKSMWIRNSALIYRRAHRLRCRRGREGGKAKRDASVAWTLPEGGGRRLYCAMWAVLSDCWNIVCRSVVMAVGDVAV